jgi:hypothetical protein
VGSLVILTQRALSAEGDRAAILEGVREVAAPGLPGTIAVYGPNAQAIVVGQTGGGAQVAVVASARAGKGRIVAFGHNGYFNKDNLDQADTARLLANAVRWAGSARAKPGAKQAPSPRVGVLRQPDLLASLQAAGLNTAEAQPADDLSAFDVLVAEPEHLGGPEAIAAVRTYIGNGGGLVTSATGWGWAQIHRQNVREFAGNALLAGSGLAWTEGSADKTGPVGFTTTVDVSPATNADSVLKALFQAQEPTDADMLTGLESVRLTLESLPAGNSKFANQASQFLKSLAVRKVDLVPTAKNPADAKTDRSRRFAIGIETALTQALPADSLTPLPAAADFPGLPADGAKLITRTGTIDTSIPGWQSLGLYAAPGAKITVTVAESDVPLRLSVQIGSHTDTLWHLDRWERLPAIVRRFPIEGPKTTAANALGGLVYIDVPHGISPPRKLEVSVAGAIDAPLFWLGSTTKDDWQKTIRNRPAPWAELAGKRVIFTVPSELIRQLDDPEPLMQWWDAVVESQVAFARTSNLERPERIVADRQISAGYMHSGYPIMVPIDGSTTHALDLSKLKAEGTWGHLHELGHNFQSGDWTFDGTGEVTNNLLVLHTFDTLLKLPFDAGHDAIRGKAMRTERIRKHLAAGAPFEKWKDDPFLALMMYAQLYEAFGWEPFDRVFAEYAALGHGEHPRGDNAKRDQWLVRMSKATGKNLGPFFQAWGVPTSEKARDSVKDLPSWMPEEMASPTPTPTPAP